ncbi:hypothetical protein [Arthrobacter monumenti]
MQKINHGYLHIGTEKTGTTTVQAFFAKNRNRLSERRTLYSRSLARPWNTNHIRLATYAGGDDRIKDLRKPLGLLDAEAISAHRREVETDLKDELLSLPETEALVLSNEHCHSQLVHHEEVRRVHDLLKMFCQNVTVIVYIRPQHELALSKYSTHIKLGGQNRQPFPDVNSNATYYNYDHLIRRWEEVFGRKNMVVRVFEKEAMVEGDIVHDFAVQLGLDIRSCSLPERKNQSLNPTGIEFLRRMNPHFPRFINNAHNPSRSELVSLVERTFPGHGPQVSQQKALDFYSKFAESNEAVRRRYFPDRSTLFTPNFDSIDDAGAKVPTTEAEWFKLFADFWRQGRTR